MEDDDVRMSMGMYIDVDVWMLLIMCMWCCTNDDNIGMVMTYVWRRCMGDGDAWKMPMMGE